MEILRNIAGRDTKERNRWINRETLTVGGTLKEQTTDGLVKDHHR